MMHAPFAYLGPGSGFAFLGSFLSVLLSLVASFLSLLLWPFRMVRTTIRRGRTMRKASIRRIIFLQLNGLDSDVAERLPSLVRLKDQGSYHRLPRTPAAPWPASFWKILKRHAVDSTVLSVAGSFAADDFAGRRLFAAGASTGFTWFTKKAQDRIFEGGKRSPLVEADGVLLGKLGSDDRLVLFRVVDAEGETGLEIAGESYSLKPHEFTPWIRMRFGAAHGIVRFLRTGTGPDVSLYATAVQIDPEKPSRPLSQPHYYANYLAKLVGTFSSSDLSDAAAALKAGVIDEDDFTALAKLSLSEQEAVFLSALEHQQSGMLACAFESPNQIAGEVDRLIGRIAELAGSRTAVFVALSGALFCNRKLDAEIEGIEDLAPAALQLFGIRPPEWMEGKSVISVA